MLWCSFDFLCCGDPGLFHAACAREYQAAFDVCCLLVLGEICDVGRSTISTQSPFRGDEDYVECEMRLLEAI